MCRFMYVYADGWIESDVRAVAALGRHEDALDGVAEDGGLDLL